MKNEIYIFSTPQVFGGSEIFQIKLAALLQRQRRLIIVSPRLTPLESGLTNLGASFIELPAGGGLALRYAFIVWLWKHRNFFRETKAVIVLNGRGSSYSAPLVRILVGIAPVLICHTTFTLKKTDVKEMLYGLAARFSRCVIAVSETVAEQHGQCWPGIPVKVIPNWLDCASDATISRWNNTMDATIQLAVVGRLATGKGIDDVIAACVGVQNIELHVYGDGPLREQFSKMTSEMSWLHLYGHVTDLTQRLPKHSILVSGSHSESFSYSVAEGIQAGLLCVVSDLPAHRELLGPDYPSFLFFQSGNITALRASLLAARELLNDDHGAGAYSAVMQARSRIRIRNDPDTARKCYLSVL